MAMHNEKVTLDVSKKLPLDVIRLRQGEGGLTTIEATILDNGKPYDLTGCSVMFYANDPKGYRIYDTATITTAKDGRVNYVVGKNLTNTYGKVERAYFNITKGSNIITSQDIPMFILKNVDLSGEEAHEYESEFEKLLQSVRDLVATSNGVLEDATSASQHASDLADEMNRDESARKSAESSRVTAENGRVTAESSRVRAEAERASAEQSREDAEAERVRAENERARAEAGRVDEWAELSEDARTSTEATRQATQKANQAAERVDNAIDEANRSATRANAAADRVDESIKLATDAAGDATIAASVANATNERANQSIRQMGELMDTFVTIVSTEVRYAPGDSPTSPPGTGWTAAPQASQSPYLWTRVTEYLSNGKSDVHYSVARQGADGRDGIGALTSGLFWLWVDGQGDLYATYSDDTNPPEFRYDRDTGNVYAVL